MAFSLSEVQVKTSKYLGDSTYRIWSAAELNGYLETAYKLLCRETKIHWGQAYLGIKTGIDVYPFPSTMFEIDRVTWNGKRLNPTTTRRLSTMDSQFGDQLGGPGLSSEQGDPIAYSTDEAYNSIRVYRTPNANAENTSSDTLPTTTVRADVRVEGYQFEDLSAGPARVPKIVARLLRYYAMWKALERQGPGQTPKLAKHYSQRWDVGIKLLASTRTSLRAGRVGRMGGGIEPLTKIPRPQLPWNFGRVVK